MPVFKDTNSREWSIRFDGVLLKELREAHNINLADIGGASYALLHSDPSALTTAVCFLCGEQLKTLNQTDKQLAMSLYGEALDDAWAAIWEAAKVFFPPRLWSALQLRFGQQIQMLDGWGQIQPVLSLLNQPEVPAGMRDAAMAELAKMIQGMSISDLQKLATNPSATGPVESPLNAATDSPVTAESNQAA